MQSSPTEDVLTAALRDTIEGQKYTDLLEKLKVQVKLAGLPLTEENLKTIKSELTQLFREFLTGKEKSYVHILAPYLLKGSYKQSSHPLEIQEWFVVHDDRIILSPLDLPEPVLQQLFSALRAQGMEAEDIIKLCHENMKVSMNYACKKCYHLQAAVTGWDYKNGKRPKGGRWSCRACSARWSGEDKVAVAYVIQWGDAVLTFYGRYGFSDWIQRNWGEVYQRWRHWSAERCDYLAKHEPTTTMRDVVINTYESTRLIVGDEAQRILHNHILHVYDHEKHAVDTQLWFMNYRRVRFYVGRMGRYGWFSHQRKGLKRLLEDPTFVERNNLTTHYDPQNQQWVAREDQYFLYNKDFAPKADGSPYTANDPELFTQEGGGRIKLSAYLRVFGHSKASPVELLGDDNDRWALLPEWTCDDKGQPMTREDINKVINAWNTKSKRTPARSVCWEDQKKGPSSAWYAWARNG